MRGLFTVHGALLGFGLFLMACAARTPAAADPTSVEPTNDEPRYSEEDSMTATRSGQSLDVGMEFKDKGDDETRRTHHEAPPTATWKPVEKEKAADPKKPTVTAAR